MDEADVDPTLETDDGDPAASDDAELPARPLDGNAAAAAELLALGDDAVTPTSLATWYTDSVAPGKTQHWYWNNANPTAVYQVGLSPVGATTTSPCTFEVTRTWDVQKHYPEREFHFYVKNIGSITCGAHILLESKQPFVTWGTGGLEPGGMKAKMLFDDANALDAVYLAGVSPSGATTSNPCEIDVTRTWEVQQPWGAREFNAIIKNVGDIACQGDVQLARTTSATTSFETDVMSSGASRTYYWNNANPLDRVYVPGLSPAGATGFDGCHFEVMRTYYRQKINTNGNTEREFYLTVKNIGGLACSATVLLNHMD